MSRRIVGRSVNRHPDSGQASISKRLRNRFDPRRRPAVRFVGCDGKAQLRDIQGKSKPNPNWAKLSQIQPSPAKDNQVRSLRPDLAIF
jgi:hypothetical protein